MSQPSSWNELPGDLLREVFAFVEDTSDWKEFRRFLYPILFVCKNWSKTASYRLYQRLDLIQSEIPYIASTLRTKPDIGPLVKSIKIHLDVEDKKAIFPPNLDHHLNIILRCSPNLEAFGSTSSTFEPLVTWRLLGQAGKSHHECMKFISLMDKCIPTCRQYTSLCFKFIDSLSELRLCPEVLPGHHISEAANCRELKERIHEFTSLTRLQLWGNSIAKVAIITEIDNLIDCYLCKVPSLELRECMFSSNDDYTGKANPNCSVKNLQLTDCLLSAFALQYFATKLQALEEFTLTTGARSFAEPETKDHFAEWWSELTDVCRNAQHYDISIKDLKTKTYLHQIRGCAELSNALAQGTTEFTVIFDIGKSTSKSYAIEMKQNGSSVRLFDRSKDGQAFMQIVRIADIFQALEPCVPNIIRVLDIKYDLRPERVLEYLVHIAKKENVGILQRFEKKSWAVFNAIMSLIDDKAVLLVQLDKTIFPGSGAGEIAVSRDTSISELKLTNCVFYDDALRKMSPKLPKVDKLILSRCIFPTESTYQINIDFPETKLGHLELSLNSIFDSSRIVTPGKCHTLSVAIGDVMRNYVYAEHGHQKTYQATDNEPVIESRCAVNFHISIKCKELQSLSVSDVNVF